MDKKYIVALELSGSQTKGVLASVALSHSGTVAIPTIEAIVTESNADCVQYGRVQNVITAAKKTDLVLKKLQETPCLEGETINGAYLALAGRSLASEKASAEIVLPSEMVINKEIIRNLFIEASKMASPNRQVLKVLPRKYVVDTQTMPNPEGALGHRLRGDFTLVTCNPTNQRNIELVAADREHVDLKIKDFVVTPLAVADMVLDEESKQLGCILVDVGYQTITISIYKDRALQYLSTLPMGSHNITRDISVGLNWTMEKAEKMKCTQGDALPEQTRGTDEAARMNAYVAARAYEIVANINANIDYANYKAADLPAGIILVGRGALLHNFDSLLAAQSKMKVKYAKVPPTVSFGIDTRTIRDDDYMSLIAIIMRICRNNDFANCVTPAKTEAPAPVAPETPLAPPTPPAPAAPAERKNVPDDEDWAKDDPEDVDEAPRDTRKTKPEPKPEPDTKTKKGGILGRLQEKWANIMSSTTLDDDTEI